MRDLPRSEEAVQKLLSSLDSLLLSCGQECLLQPAPLRSSPGLPVPREHSAPPPFARSEAAEKVPRVPLAPASSSYLTHTAHMIREPKRDDVHDFKQLITIDCMYPQLTPLDLVLTLLAVDAIRE